MDKDIKVMIVPDVHGRDFWREPVLSNLDKEIIFLGDYLDPYPREGITRERAIEVFKEIVELRKKHNNITLLLGNHDCSYPFKTSICECRHDWGNHSEIAKVFNENFDMFDIAKEKIINKKHFFFCHAGVHKSWIKANSFIFPKGFNPSAKNFNKLLHQAENKPFDGFSNALDCISYHRGGYDCFGSIVWADLREFLDNDNIKKSKKIFVVGHTMLNGVAVRVSNNLYCIDCQKVFYIDSNGVLRYYDDDEEITISI